MSMSTISLSTMQCHNMVSDMILEWSYLSLKNIHHLNKYLPRKYSPQRNIHRWKIFTPGKYSPLKNIHPLKKYSRRQPISHFKFLNSLLLINIAYIGSWKHFVFVFVCVCVSLSLYLSFCKSSSRSLSSPDDKLSEIIWFVWSKTSFDGDKWRCEHGDNQPESENNVSQQIDKGLLDCWRNIV